MVEQIKKEDVLEIKKADLEVMIEKQIDQRFKKTQPEFMNISGGEPRDKEIAFGSFLQKFGKAAYDGSESNSMKLTFKGGNPENTPNWQYVNKSLESGDVSAGGNMINQIATEFVGNLYSQSVIRQAGARVIDDPTGRYEIDKMTSQPTATWKGETEPVNATKPNTGTINMAVKQLVAVVPVSNRLLRGASYNIAEILQQDLAGAAAQAEDRAFINGSGTNHTPKGIVNWTAAGNKFNSAGNTLANTQADFGKAMGKIASADIPVANPVMLINERVKSGLMSLTDGNSNAVFMQYLNAGSYGGYRILSSNNVPIYDAGNNYAYTIFLQAGHARILQSLNLSLEFIPNAAYNNASGTVVAGASSDTSLFRLVHEVDFAMINDKAAGIIKQHTLGA